MGSIYLCWDPFGRSSSLPQPSDLGAKRGKRKTAPRATGSGAAHRWDPTSGRVLGQHHAWVGHGQDCGWSWHRLVMAKLKVRLNMAKSQGGHGPGLHRRDITGVLPKRQPFLPVPLNFCFRN